jgi:Leucine-rich repeat (LRR) protein
MQLIDNLHYKTAMILFYYCYLISNLAWSFKIETDLIFKKPYERVYDVETWSEPSPIHELDQIEPECPLPFQSSSQQTGCFCNINSKAIDCVYINRLNSVPEFVKSLSPSESANPEQIPEQQIVEWNVNLKCRNFSILSDFRPFFNLKVISLLDLSAATAQDKCRLSNYFDGSDIMLSVIEKPVKFNKSNILKPVLMSEVGDDATISHQAKPKHNQRELVIKKLDLSSNRIINIHLNRFSVDSVHIKSIDLSNNSLRSLPLTVKSNFDVCYMELDELILTFNEINYIDIDFLVFMRNLNLSSNQLTRFGIEYFDTFEFKSYFNQSCKMKLIHVNTTHNKTLEFYRSSLVNLDLSHNLIRSVPFGHLHNILFTQLIMVNMSYNQIKKFNNYDFNHMRTLRHLDLKANLIETLEESMFVNLMTLRFLDLSHNFLTTLPIGVFQSQDKTLEHLNLNNNYLSAIPVETFRRLSAVKYLNLNENRLRTLRNYSFGYMAHLLEISLSHNAIQFIEPKAFFIDKSALIGPGLVEKIDLSTNKIETLNSSIFVYLTNLRYLILSNNNIRQVDPNAFLGISYLISLDLSLNLIRNIDFLYNRNFSHSLRMLKLSNNEIGGIRAGQFVHLNSLTHLDLSANNIKYLADCAFYGLQESIKKLILNFNRITSINSCTFSIDFRSLRFIQIMHNPINCTNNCDFFFAVYNYPYAISYHGIECVNNTVGHDGSGSESIHCSREQYENIYGKCREKFLRMNCSRYLNHTFLEESVANSNRAGGDYEGQYDSKNNGESNGNKVDKLLVKTDAIYKNTAQSSTSKLLISSRCTSLLAFLLVSKVIKFS